MYTERENLITNFGVNHVSFNEIQAKAMQTIARCPTKKLPRRLLA